MADNKEDIALSVKNVSKTFKLPHERHSGLKQSLLTRLGGRHQKGYELQHVLKDISFDVKKGEFFGIVGRNGSGKSTLLKLISDIYVPDSGNVKINGSLTPFIELGVGFNNDLSGRENVYMNGALMGFSRDEMDAKYEEIVAFAELENFMDQKLKNYSSGMQVRLAFSIAIQSDSDILILDEVLAVGDEAFQQKCNDYFMNIKENPDKTVILVTHGMGNVKKYCDRAMMIRDGEVVIIGDPNDVADEYSLENLKVKQVKKEDKSKTLSTESIKDLTLELLSPDIINQSEKAKLKVTYVATEDQVVNTLVYLNDDKRRCYLIGARSKNKNHKAGDKVEQIVSFDLSQINDATIKAGAEIWSGDKPISRVHNRDSPIFMLRRTDYAEDEEHYSVINAHGRWEDEN